jgi:hypothetical protein
VLGSLLARAFGRARPGRVLAVSGAVVAAALAIVVAFVRRDPFEYDLRKLQSTGHDAAAERAWMRFSDAEFGRGHAGRTFLAVDRPDDVAPVVAALRARGGTIGEINSILDVIPDHQRERLAALADIRATLGEPLLADPALVALRPHADLREIGVDDLPATLRARLAERDGRVGYLLSIQPAAGIDGGNGHDLIRFASAVRRIDLPDGRTVTTSGSSVVFADILSTIRRDGPRVTAIACAGLVVMVVVAVGWNRRAIAVLAATSTGALLMIAACALAGLKVSFLDFVALPITLGLGIDYAVNVAHRDDDGLATSGSAVVVCSATTMIGYGSVLLSDNLAIRGFGLASLIGEVTCVLAALVVVPALAQFLRRVRSSSATVRA